MTVDWGGVTSRFGLGTQAGAPRPVSGGLSHSVWRLETDSGTYAVKLLRNIWGTADFLPRLERAARFEYDVWRTGVPMPRPVLHQRTGRAVQPLSRDTWVRVHDWVDATPVRDGTVPLEVAAQVGSAMAAIHRAGTSAADPQSALPWHDSGALWIELADRFPPLQEALPAVAAAETFLRRAGKPAGLPVMTHGDIDQKNLLVTGEGAVVIVDWDVCATMPAESELIRAALDLAGWQYGPVDERVLRAALESYRTAGGPAGPLRVEHLGWALLLHLDWLAFNVARALGNCGTEQVDLGRQVAPYAVSQLTCMATTLEVLVSGGIELD